MTEKKMVQYLDRALPWFTHELPDLWAGLQDYLEDNRDQQWARRALRRIKLAKRCYKFAKAARKAAPLLWDQCERINT